MFDFLQDLSRHELITGVYYAIRRLNHPKRIADAVGDVSPADRRVASRVLAEIKTVEGTSWKPGDANVVEKYILELCGIVSDRNRRELKLDPERGRRYLARLHKLVANGNHRGS